MQTIRLSCHHDFMRLGTVLRKWRMMEERSVRDVAKEVKISSATLNRVEHNYPCDSDTLAAILAWLLGRWNAK